MRLVGPGRGRLFGRRGGLGGILRAGGWWLGGGGLVRGVWGGREKMTVKERVRYRLWLWLCRCSRGGGLGGRLCRRGEG